MLQVSEHTITHDQLSAFVHIFLCKIPGFFQTFSEPSFCFSRLEFMSQIILLEQRILAKTKFR